MREDATGKVEVPGLSEWIVLKPEDIMTLMRRGDAKRKIASTNMNKQSSRSHAIFQMVRSPLAVPVLLVLSLLACIVDLH